MRKVLQLSTTQKEMNFPFPERDYANHIVTSLSRTQLILYNSNSRPHFPFHSCLSWQSLVLIPKHIQLGISIEENENSLFVFFTNCHFLEVILINFIFLSELYLFYSHGKGFAGCVRKKIY